MKNPTGISEKWKSVAKGWVGDSWGRHCHWCKHIEHNDGESSCGNFHSKFFDNSRIRTWDGLHCAKECGFFELDEWYKSDKNHESTFSRVKE